MVNWGRLKGSKEWHPNQNINAHYKGKCAKDGFDGCAALFQEEMRSSGLAWNGLGIIKENGRENKGQPIETANRLLGFHFLFLSHSFTVFFPFFHPGRSLWHLNSQLASDIDWPIKWPFLLFICMVADWYLFYFRYSWQLMTMWCWRLTSVSTDQFSLCPFQLIV